MTFVPAADAAARLGTTVRQVERLASSGELPAERTVGGAWLLDAAAVAARVRAPIVGGRPWSPPVAWAGLWLVAGLEPGWLAARPLARLKARLPGLSAADLVGACRRRAGRTAYRASASFLADIAERLVLTGASAMDSATFAMSPDGTRIDGYCASAAVEALTGKFFLVPDFGGNVMVRETDCLGALGVKTGAAMPWPVVAADLTESADPRERAAGLRALEAAL